MEGTNHQQNPRATPEATGKRLLGCVELQVTAVASPQGRMAKIPTCTAGRERESSAAKIPLAPS